MLDLVHQEGTSAMGFESERPVGAAAAVLVEGSQPAGDLVALEEEPAREGGRQGGELLDGGIGDAHPRAFGRTGWRWRSHRRIIAFGHSYFDPGLPFRTRGCRAYHSRRPCFPSYRTPRLLFMINIC